MERLKMRKVIILVLAIMVMQVVSTAEEFTKRYIFIPGQSTLRQTGGIAGIDELFTIEGYFRVTIDYDANTAHFDYVNAIATNDSNWGPHDINEVFQMTQLVSTEVNEFLISFEDTNPPIGGIDINLLMSFQGNQVHLTGTRQWPSVMDSFQYDINAVAQNVVEYYIYVDDDANGLNNGSSWADAYNYLQDALADANSSEKPVEIRVAQGTYTPDSNSAEPNGTGDREAAFKMINEVTLKGGYAGFGEPDPNVRDIELYETTLSGDLEGNDAEEVDPCDLLTEPTRAENSFHVAIGGGWDGAPTGVLDGFMVIGGNANYIGGRGGGIGGFDGLISNCTIKSNSAHIQGGGLHYCHGMIQNCTITGNQASYGGGIYICWSEPEIINCIISGNIASEYDSGGLGGGLLSHASSPTLIGCTFSDNWAAEKGGGMHSEASDNGSSPKLINCKFNGNSAWFGGGLHDSEGNTVITNCRFSANSARRDGGAIYTKVGEDMLTNCLLIDNSAPQGAAVYNNDNNTTFTNCTFAGNFSYHGSALGCDSWSHQYASNIRLVDCILWDDMNQIWIGDNSQVAITYSNVQGGWPGEGNIDVAPCFVDVDSNDYHLKSQAGRWEPNSQSWIQDEVTSPCIEAGDMASPIGFEPFPNGGRVNMGAYGGTAQASKSYFGKPVCEVIVAGDINGDCEVNFKDFAFIAYHWLEDNNPEYD